VISDGRRGREAVKAQMLLGPDVTTSASVVAPPEPLLEARGLVAGYGEAAVVSGIDLHVNVGEIVALFGPNGAGK